MKVGSDSVSLLIRPCDADSDLMDYIKELVELYAFWINILEICASHRCDQLLQLGLII